MRLLTLIDLRAGGLSALLMGSVVWGVNMLATSPPDVFGATTAALKQAAYTFLISGALLRLGAWLALRPSKYPVLMLLTSVFVPGSIASGATYFVHSLRGTPSPFLSTLPTILLVLVGLPIWTVYQRWKPSKPAKGHVSSL